MGEAERRGGRRLQDRVVEAGTGNSLREIRRLEVGAHAEDPPGDLTVFGPDGSEAVVAMPETAPGRYQADWQAPVTGLFRLVQGELTRVVAVGPSAPREFEETIADSQKLAPAVAATRGGVLLLEDGIPDIRAVRDGRQASGRGWIGIVPRGAYVTQDISIAALLPGWLYLLLGAGLALMAWLVEGRRIAAKTA